MTLVEIVVVLGIVGLLATLSLLGLTRARESARQMNCRNNLRQIGTGVLLFEGAKKHFPTNGWGYTFLPDSFVDPRYGQPGGWSYQLLPYLELASLYELAHSHRSATERDANTVKLVTTEIPVYQCPSKSAPLTITQADYSMYYTNLKNPPRLIAGGHYAANHGTYFAKSLRNGESLGPENFSPEAIAEFDWPKKDECDGVCYNHLKFQATEIANGLSNTIWAGEKHIAPPILNENDPGGHDQSFLSGDCRDNRRLCFNPPRSDSRTDGKIFDFGSSHPTMMFALFLDGSTQPISFEVEQEVFRSHGHRLKRKW
jgi:hypothetical protein